MIGKCNKIGIIGIVAVALLGGLVFGRKLVSYVRSSASSVRNAVKDNVPIEFDLRRAHDLLDQIIPEMNANVRLIAEEEVKLAQLKADIEQSHEAVVEKRSRVSKLRNFLNIEQAQYRIGQRRYSHEQVRSELARRFDRIKEADIVLAGKEKLLAARENSLAAAVQMLERTRAQKTFLADRIESLESQH